MKLSVDEKKLYETLVVWLTIRMTRVTFDLPPQHCRPCEDEIHTKGCIVGHGHLSAFEAACAELWKLGLAEPLGGNLKPMVDPSRGCAYYRIASDIPEVRQRLRRALPPAAPKLTEVLKAFVLVATEYDGLPTVRGPFSPPADFETLFEPLLRCNYAQRLGRNVRWTNRIAPQMRAAWVWDKAGHAKEDVHQSEAEKMWRTLPLKVRNAFFSGGPVDVVSLAMVVDFFWVEGEWRYIDDLSRARKAVGWRPESLQLAKDMVALFESAFD